RGRLLTGIFQWLTSALPPLHAQVAPALVPVVRSGGPSTSDVIGVAYEKACLTKLVAQTAEGSISPAPLRKSAKSKAIAKSCRPSAAGPIPARVFEFV